MPRRLSIKRITRFAVDGPAESLEFAPGVNVIVGAPNTGKSSWLRLLDYLFGDDDAPSKKLKRHVATRYHRAQAVVEIDGAEVSIEREWGDAAARSKVLLGGVSVGPEEFSNEFLEQLGLPVLRVPKGNPYSAHKWPRLSWRTLLRHIYRHEFSWSDIADKQPPGDQHAALMVFLGEASRLFPVEFGQLVDRQRRKLELEARKEQFISTLEEISRELLAIQEASVALTPVSIEQAIGRLTALLEERRMQREQLLDEVKASAEAQLAADQRTRTDKLELLGERLAGLRVTREQTLARIAAARERREQLDRHRRAVVDDLAKLARLAAAQEVLADLRITHCPSCDQALERQATLGRCRLCLQDLPEPTQHATATAQRVDFEEQQLRAEAAELEELIRALSATESDQLRSLRDLEDQAREIEARLTPVRAAAAWFIPPELSVIDQEQGQLTEQIRQLNRVQHVLQRREDLTSEIDRLSQEIRALESEVRSKARAVRFSRGEELLAGGMNDYLNALNAGQPRARWESSSVQARIADRGFRLLIGGRDWREEVGGTYTCYFLAAYNYALLSLCAHEGIAYPGLALVDLPPNLSDIKLLKDEENYLVEPFVTLLRLPRNSGTQLIITGHAYSQLEGVNRIELTEVYSRAGDEEAEEENEEADDQEVV